jgi:hypothetical protein
MGVETIPGTDLKYGLIIYDKKGRERSTGAGKPASAQVIEQARTAGATDVFFFCHGWKGDLPAAKDQYNRWMGALMASADRQKAEAVFPGFKPLLVGLHWPSQPWGDEKLGADDSFAAGGGTGPEDLLRTYVEILGDDPPIVAALRVIIDGARQGAAADALPPELTRAYRDLNAALGLESKGVAGPPDADREGFDPDALLLEGDSFGLGLGGVLGPLRQLSYWTMKKRAREIGEGGIHAFLKELQQASPARIHLMGHSFGTIVVSGMIAGPDARGPLLRPIDSVTLVQGAVSLWCYADDIPYKRGSKGYFNAIVADGKVRGPLTTTQSKHDGAVGTLYPFASKINGSASFGAGLPEYGAIGAFGLQGLAQTPLTMQEVGGAYALEKGRIYNVESSQFICKGEGIGGAHSDIDGPQVAHLIWETAFASK